MLFIIRKSQIFMSAFVIIVFTLSLGMYNFAKEDTVPKPDGKVIVIDPGHGGMDGGAVGSGGTLEKDINLNVANYLKEIAESDGKKVIMTRSEDVSLNTSDSSKVRTQKRSDLENRRTILNENKNGIFISIHMNKFNQQNVKGAQTFYANNDQSRMLALSIQNALKNGIDKENKRIAKPAPSDIYILKGCKSTAVIVECGFVSNPEEEKLLLESEYQKKLANCIYEGICDYTNN
ncbi:MAG: N-acetylmuramoyl-L-alanine amidase CwlD [Clostridia bacterium]|nr:N-acetylmuramoyl-L-alanine amidase CwlD [Clostridia bacterium]